MRSTGPQPQVQFLANSTMRSSNPSNNNIFILFVVVSFRALCGRLAGSLHSLLVSHHHLGQSKHICCISSIVFVDIVLLYTWRNILLNRSFTCWIVWTLHLPRGASSWPGQTIYLFCVQLLHLRSTSWPGQTCYLFCVHLLHLRSASWPGQTCYLFV